MTSSGLGTWADWLVFGFEIVLQVVIAVAIVLLGVWIWPSEMIRMPVKGIPLHDWVMTGGAALVASLGVAMLYFTVARLMTARRSGPARS